MRIAYVITRADEIGGAQIHVRDLATALHQAGDEVTVIAGSPGALSDQLSARGVPFQSIPTLIRRPISPRHDAMAVRQLVTILRRLRPDLVSTHSSKAGWLGRLTARLLGIPVLFTAHGWSFTEGVPSGQRRLSILAERLAGPLANHIITVSEYDRTLALDKRLARPQRITCVHNGVVDLADSMPRRQRAGPVRIVMIGRFTPQKDHAALLRSLAGQTHLEWVLDLVGDGPGLSDVAALAQSLGISDRVHLLGARNDVPDILGRADIYTLVSNWEGFPRSILEAMRARLPVIATDVGGVAEAVRHGETGFLVAHANDQELAHRLELLICNSELRQALGSAGRRSYEEHFRFELTLKRTIAVYVNVIGRADTRAAERITT
jgi:glycosyltransferase involved in cell wall biosynthesis